MSDLAESSTSVKVDGKQYNRALAEEMARDIELLAKITPKSWAIGDNSALYVDLVVALAMAEPVKHAYFIDARAADSDALRLLEQLGTTPQPDQRQDRVGVVLQQWEPEQLRTLRTAHEAMIRGIVEHSGGSRCQRWRGHNLARFRALEQIVGRELPQPGYIDDLLAWRLQEPESKDLSEDHTFPSIDRELLEYIATGIET